MAEQHVVHGRLSSIPRGKTALATIVAAALLTVGVFSGSATAVDAPELADFGIVGTAQPSFDDGFEHLVVDATPEAAAALQARVGDDGHVALITGSTYEVVSNLTADEVTAITGTTPGDDTALSLGGSWGSAQFNGLQWGLKNRGQQIANSVGIANADIAYEAPVRAGISGIGITVAVIDSGADPAHPELRDSMWSNRNETCRNGVDDDGNGYVDDCEGWDFANNDNTPFDTATAHFHGTHVATTIAGRGANLHGVAPGARIMNLKIGNGESVSVAGGARAIYYAVDNGAKVINASWGGSNPSPLATQILTDAIAYAHARGVLVVAAAGNSSLNLDATPVVPAGISSPALIAVAATGNRDELASFSNRSATKVHLGAPGVNIAAGVLNGGYGYSSGTSMAAPMVAGGAALLLSQQPTLTPSQIRSRLMATADLTTELTATTVAGGRMNIARALGLADPHLGTDTSTTPTTLPEAGDAMVTFSGFSGLTNAAPIAGRVGFHPAGADVGASYALQGQLYLLDASDVFVVQGQTVTVDGATTATDDNGRFALTATRGAADYESGIEVSLAASLPPGEYAVSVSMIDGVDPDVVLDQPAVVYFDVASDPTVEQPPASPATSVPATSPAGSGPAGGSNPAPSSPGSPSTGSPSTPGGAAPPSPSTTVGRTNPPSAPAAPATDSPAADGPAGGPATSPDNSGPSPTAPTTAPRRVPQTSTPTTANPSAPSPSQPRTPAPNSPTPNPAAPDVAPSAPASTESSSPPPTNPPAPPVASGSWRIGGASPNTCAVRTACSISISGTFPSDVSVWFGTSAVPVSAVSRTSSELRLRTPLVARAGTVDLTLWGRDGSGQVLVTQPGGFTFVDPDGTTAPTPATPTPTTPTSPTAPGAPSTDEPAVTRPTPTNPSGTAPGGPGAAPRAPSATTPAPTSPTPTTPNTPAPSPAPSPGPTAGPGTRRTPMSLGLPRTRSDGLRAARVITGPQRISRDAFTAAKCTSDPCRGVGA